MLFLARKNSALNIFKTPELYRNAKKSFVKNLKETGFYRVPYILLQVFINELNNPYLNRNVLHKFECEKTVAITFKEDDFVLLKFEINLQLADGAVSDDIKNFLIRQISF